MKKITTKHIAGMKREGRKIPVLTAYSFPIARILDTAGIPILLVGDSAGMVEAGYDTTLPVTMDEMIYHTRSVARGAKSALVVADMPFLSYQVSVEEAVLNAGRLVKEGGAEAVKLEGGARSAPAISAIVEMGVPVMGHVGLTPQSVHALGGYKVQGKTRSDAERIMDDAIAVQEAGAFSIVLEAVPASVAKAVTDKLTIPTIGIGAGPSTDGQVLVVNDMLGLWCEGSKQPRFVKAYADLGAVISKATGEYINEVEEGIFPAKEHSY